jgi:hypothetical protein
LRLLQCAPLAFGEAPANYELELSSYDAEVETVYDPDDR